MKKVVTSALAAMTLGGAAYAETLTLYTDPATGQVFTKEAEGRVEMGDFVSAKEVFLQNQEQDSILAKAKEKSKAINVTSKAMKLDFSGTHYFGFTSANPKITDADNTRSAGFELRRNYVQVKAYFNEKDYFRVTFDATKELASSPGTDSKTKGYVETYVKYAYLWLDKVLPYTGVEVGIAHRPWIDYEEHNSWHYRSFNKVALEHKNTRTEYGPDLVNSADLGMNFKSKVKYFSSEIGVYNGEGYHADKAGANQINQSGLSLEWRLTGHLLGNGDKVGKYKRTKESYANISTYGLISKDHKDANATAADSGEYDRSFYGVHAVYNQPMFLIAGQYFVATDDYVNSGDKKTDYAGWSVNGELRPIEDWTLIARYDHHTKDKTNSSGVKTADENAKQAMLAVAYNYNANVTLIASGKQIRDDEKRMTVGLEKDVYMLTTEVKW